MGVGLKRNIRCSAFCFITGLLKGNDLGVGHAIVGVSSVADDLAFGGYNDTAHERIGTHKPDTQRSLVKRPSGQFEIVLIFY